MGVGKTTVGRKLAELMNAEHLDTDRVLEKKTGVSINLIFEIEGEAGFRQRETKLLEEVSASSGQVVSTGGGIVLSPENCRRMHCSGKIVYIQASVDTLWGRLKDSTSRPLLRARNPRGVLAQLFLDREPLYLREADYIVPVTASSHQTAQNIVNILNDPSNRDSVV